MTRYGPLLGAIVILLLVLTACGGDDADGNTASETPDNVLVIVTLTPVPSATVRTEMVDYVIAEGDTLSGIADEFGISPQAIVEANDLPNPDAILVGQTLQIPAVAQSTPIN